MKMKTQLGDYKLIQYQILQIEIISIIFMADSSIGTQVRSG